MKKILFALCSLASWGATTTIGDTLYSSVSGGSWTGRIIVSLNSPASAQPLYASTTSLAGWQAVYCIGVTGTDCSATSAAGAVSIVIWPNDQITPGGTSYTARFLPTRGAAWSETWVVATGNTTLRQIRSTTVPTPTTTFALSQLAAGGATTGQYLQYSGTSWGPVTLSALSDPTTTQGDIIYRGASGLARLAVGSTGQVLKVAGGVPSWAAESGGGSGTVTSVSVTTANGVSGSVATATTTPAITLTLGAITPTSVAASGTVTGSNLSGTNTGDQTTITGNAGTATALAANGANCSAGQFPLGVNASGASENCTALPTTIAGTANQITASASTGAVTLSLPATITGLTSVTSTGFTGALTGNASTATALAANGANCGAGTYPKGVDASGAAESCTSVSLTADVSGILPVANGGTNNAFFTVSGPASSAKTYTFPNASTTILTTSAAVTVAQGGTGTGSTLTGLVRGGSPMTAAELSGDATTSGSNAVTVTRINGTALSGLATGILKNTTSTGVPSIAVAGTDYLAPAAIGSTVQAYDADLAALAGLTSAADALPYFTGSGTASVTTLTSYGRSLIDDATAAAARATLEASYSLQASCNDQTISSGTAQYCANTPTLSATPESRQYIVPQTGTITYFAVRTGSSTPTNNATCQVRINGSDQAGTVTITGGVAGPALYSATVSIAVTRGDRLSVSCTGGATTQAVFNSWALWISY